MSRWNERWQQNQTAWDLGGPHPLTASILQDAKIMSKNDLCGPWLIPGCGRAHDAPALLEAGATLVRGVDFVSLAIDEARRLYGKQTGVSLTCRDVSQVPADEQSHYRGVFDRAMLCAVHGAERQKYLDAVSQYLMPQGFFVSLAFASVARPEAGPPFEISQSEITASFAKGWEILLLEAIVSPACDQKILKEWRFIARKQPV
jgi:hypothetical protein